MADNSQLQDSFRDLFDSDRISKMSVDEYDKAIKQVSDTLSGGNAETATTLRMMFKLQATDENGNPITDSNGAVSVMDKKIKNIKDTMAKRGVDLTNEQVSQLSSSISNVNAATNALENDSNGAIYSFDSLMDAISNTSNTMDTYVAKLSEVTTAQTNFMTAKTNSKSATGLTADDVTNVQSMMDTVNSYYANSGQIYKFSSANVFKETSDGIKLNIKNIFKLSIIYLLIHD